FQHHQDFCQVWPNFVESHRAVDVPLGPLRLPYDPLVRDLIDDGGLPVPVRPEDLAAPLQLGVRLLLDLLHLLHEAGEVSELRPLVVGDADRYADVDVLDDVGHLGVAPTGSPAAARRLLDLLGDLLGGLLGDVRPCLGQRLGQPTSAASAPPIMSLPFSCNALFAFCPSPPSRPVICWVTRFPATFISSPSSDFYRSVGSLSAIFSRVE